MRAYQFLNEYDRNKTATPLRQKILQNFANHERYSGDVAKMAGIANEYGTLDQDKTLNFIMTQIEAGDPTPNKIYTPWLTREYSKGNIKRLEDIHARYKTWMADHFKYKNKRDFPAELKDIMRIDAPSFLKWMIEYEPPQEELKNKGDAEVVFDSPSARVIYPKDQAAACYYGQGTRWCTAATRGTNYFDRYNSDGPLYIILPKQPKHQGEKYQLHFYDEQFMDEEDREVSITELLGTRFPDLREFFFKVEPTLKGAIAFADDSTLTQIIRLMVPPVQERLREAISEWESDDDYYRGWQEEKARELGYLLNADGTPFEGDIDELDEDEINRMDIDWDRVHEDDDINDYGDFNDDYRAISRDIQEMSNWDASEVRQAAEELEERDDGMMNVTDMDEILYRLVDYNVGDNNIGYVLEFIRSKLFVRSKHSTKTGGTVLGTVGNYVVGM